MSAGKSSGSSTTIPTLSADQNADIRARTAFFQNSIVPAYSQAVAGATDVYNNAAGGVTNAGQNLASMGTQVQDVAGSTGESALRTGVAGLESLFTPDYVKQQLNAAMQPAQLQYQQNLANQQAQFGGAGNLGSARSALAQTALAGQTQAQQQAASAQILNQIQQGQLQAGSALAGIGQGGLNQALTGAKAQTEASLIPQNLYNQYASILFGTPAGSYTPASFGAPSTTTNTTGSQLGFKI